MGRKPRSRKIVGKNHSWSPKEDAILKEYIRKHGIGRSWKALANNSGLRRSSRSCRARWLNYLRPGIKLGHFTKEEDDIICALYQEIGSCWTVIAAHLPGRSDQAIKNQWSRLKRKKAILSCTYKLDSDDRTEPSKIASSRPAFPDQATAAIDPLPDFCELANWYIMTPPHHIWEAASYSSSVNLDNVNWC